MNIEKTNHTVDDIFSKGLSDFQVAPLADTKKNIFASPIAIRPIKPWYIASKNIIIISSALLVSSFLFYYFFFDNSIKEGVTNNQNSITANTTINNVISTKYQNNAVVENIENKKTFTTNNIKYKEVKNKKYIENSSNNNTPDNQSESEKIRDASTPLNMTAPLCLPAHNKQVSTKTTPLENNNIANNTYTQSANNAVINKVNTKNDLNISATESFRINSFENNNLLTHNNEIENICFLQKRNIQLLGSEITPEFLLRNKESDYHLKGLWFFELKAGGVVINYNLKGKDSEWDNAANAKQNILATSYGAEFQSNAVYQKNHWIIKGGLSYVNYGEKIKGQVLLTNPKSETNIIFNGGHFDTLISGNYYIIDTIGNYYHYTYTQTNHIFISDSVLAWHTHNMLADVYDTTHITLFDSLPKTTINNSIRYIEIPLSIGYVIPYGRFTIGLNATVAPGYFINVKGSNMNAEQYPAIEQYKKSTIRKYTLSACAELEFGYQINLGLMLSVSPFYRKSLFPIYNNEYNINQKASYYGFRVGIRKLL